MVEPRPSVKTGGVPRLIDHALHECGECGDIVFKGHGVLRGGGCISVIQRLSRTLEIDFVKRSSQKRRPRGVLSQSSHQGLASIQNDIAAVANS
jgi:hypothetical protein